MTDYTYNRDCACPRCRAKGLMGAAVLITLGILFLLDQVWVARFDETFPVLLIVIGVVLYMGRTASIEGHVQPHQAQPPLAPPPPAINSQGPEVNR